MLYPFIPGQTSTGVPHTPPPPPQPISYKLAISEPVSVFPLETLDSDFVSCAVATAAVLPCSHLVARTCEAVDVPERESINLTGTRLGTYISC